MTNRDDLLPDYIIQRRKANESNLDYWMKHFEEMTAGEQLCNCTILAWITKLNNDYKQGKHPEVEKFPRLSEFFKNIGMRYRITTGNSINENSKECGC